MPLGPGKPIVLTFDNGYESQYTNALPVLKRLGWVGVENIQLSGLPPSEGGLTDAQVKGLIDAGWELDTQGISHADLIKLDSSQLQYQIVTARQMLRSRYGVPVNWFCYPSGPLRLDRDRGRAGGRLRRLHDRRPGLGEPRRGSVPAPPPAGAGRHQPQRPCSSRSPPTRARASPPAAYGSA